MSPQKKITIFLSLTVLFSGLSYIPIISAGTANVQGGVFVLTMMWSPGLAAILTQLSGVVWAAWHMPVIFFADYHTGDTPVTFAAACFAVMIVGISFPFAWLTLKSGSLWTAVLLHTTHNVFIQGFFDRLTGSGGVTPYITGEFGIGLALTGLVTAYVFWRRRQDTPQQTQSVQVRLVVQPE